MEHGRLDYAMEMVGQIIELLYADTTPGRACWACGSRDRGLRGRSTSQRTHPLEYSARLETDVRNERFWRHWAVAVWRQPVRAEVAASIAEPSLALLRLVIRDQCAKYRYGFARQRMRSINYVICRASGHASRHASHQQGSVILHQHRFPADTVLDRNYPHPYLVPR